MTNQLLDTFTELSKLPTTSFYEQKILEYIKTKLTSYKIEFHQEVLLYLICQKPNI